MNRPIRETLAESHIAPIAMALLLVSALQSICGSASAPLFFLADYVITAVAIGGIPSPDTSSHTLLWANSFFNLFTAVTDILFAWFLSRLVYGAGPFQVLNHYRSRVMGRQ